MIDFVLRFWEPALYFLVFLILLVLVQKGLRKYDEWFANRHFWGWRREPKVVADYGIMKAPFRLALRKLAGLLGALSYLVFVYYHAQQDSVNLTLMVLGFALLVLLPFMPFIILRDLTRQFEYDRHTIRKSSIYGRSITRNLRDIVDIEAPPAGFRAGVILCFADNHKMTVSSEYDGFGDFLTGLAKHNQTAFGLLTTAQVLPDPRGGYRADLVAKF